MTAEDKAVSYFKKAGGILKTSQAMEQGIRPELLYKLRDKGILESMGWGVYKLAEQGTGTDPQIINLALKHKKAVLCLTSALFIHKLTTQIPRQIYVALPKGSRSPDKAKGKVQFFTIAKDQYDLGIEVHEVDGVKLKVYDPEKTVVDCFKFRNKIGLDLAIEALREWKKGRSKNMKKLFAYAKACRVEKVMMPYLEAMT